MPPLIAINLYQPEKTPAYIFAQEIVLGDTAS